MFKLGNHKLVTTEEAKTIVKSLAKEDTKMAYVLSLTTACIQKIRRAKLYHLGLAHQLTVYAKVNTVPNKRVTHKLSFPR
mmetsp:Transcript_53864/g.161170  ORF Transcript_53864/g.161170 Transcript_53864/m.161170 type:complete len:80 (-) Transcript_53864:3698-3937(-)